MKFSIINPSLLHGVLEKHGAAAETKVVAEVQVTIVHLQAEEHALRKKKDYVAAVKQR